MVVSSEIDGSTAESMSVEDTNALRRSLGLAPLSETPAPAEDVAVTNFKTYMASKAKEEETRLIQERIKMARETRETQRRFTGKGLGEADDDDGDLDLRSWVIKHRKRDFSGANTKSGSSEVGVLKKQKKTHEVEYTPDQLEGIKVSHDIVDINEGEEMILTLKDSKILENDESGDDELENIGLVEKEKLEKNLENKKKPLYSAYDDEEFGQEQNKTILSHYDEKVKKGFVIGDTSHVLQDETWKKSLQETFSLNHAPSENVLSDYQDASEIVIKKKKKKKTRVSKVDHDLITSSVDVKSSTQESNGFIQNKDFNFDNVSFVDDDDLQACLARQRNASRRKNVLQPENVARIIKQQIMEESNENADKDDEKGLIIDETTEFVRGIQVTSLKTKSKPSEDIKYIQSIETNVENAEETYLGETKDPNANSTEYLQNISTTGIEDEADITSGVGVIFNLLKQKGIVDKQTNEKLSIQQAQHEHALFLAEQRKLRKRLEEEARHRKEMDRCNGKLDRMTPREKELYLQAENQRHAMIEARELQKLFANWTPVVQLKYNDEFGREIKEKEAYKFLSHQFHGKGSGKAKVDERLRRLAEEKRREQQSIFSYNK
ncbi:unnamed protein product [Pneumocystis jirovecii]|uniref:SART-1 protein n=1 Tax=Pneumocystis jirovecii TaxID=42068 RepID=L0P6R0_PNEJI|nr:unnamed protein product [Pneumocystis jirovecii]